MRWRPEWPFALVVAAAWTAVVAGVGVHTEHAQMHDHHPGHSMQASPMPWLPAALLGWTVMSVAMMAPIALPAVRHVGLNSIRSRRRWAMSIYFATYVAIWVVVGVVASAVAEAIKIDNRTLLAVLLVVAAGWQLTSIKRRSLNRCWRTVALPPVGRRADAACARFAWRQALRCLTSCWALMAVMAAVQQAAVVWMIALTALIATEELTLFGRRLLGLTAAALSVFAGLVVFGS
ncbi:DUF2182 domain-containing protein [Kribbella sp. NPDC026611]|uniref:copper chaperone n=1 Tax=Kribbella sp. NPDC026611 TaxID=3154911 RepID=UPI0033D1151C